MKSWDEIPDSVVHPKLRYTCACGAPCRHIGTWDYNHSSNEAKKLGINLPPLAKRVVKNLCYYGSRPADKYPLKAMDLVCGQKPGPRVKCAACAEKEVLAAHEAAMVVVNAEAAAALARAQERFPDLTAVRREARIRAIRDFVERRVVSNPPNDITEYLRSRVFADAWQNEYTKARADCVAALGAAFPEAF